MDYIEPEDMPEPEEPEEPSIYIPEEPVGPKIIQIITKTIKPRIIKKTLVNISAEEGAETRFDHDIILPDRISTGHFKIRFLQTQYSKKA